MTAGSLITNDLQVEFNGQLMGDDVSGLEIVSFTPFQYPAVRSSDYERPLDHGLIPGTDYFGGRTVYLQLEVWGGWTAVREVLSAFTLGTEAALVWQLGTVGKLQVNARVRKRDPLVIDEGYAVGNTTTVTVEFYCTDPRVYSNAVNTVNATLTTASPGLTFNVTPNLSFGGASTSGAALITNAGTFETRPVIRINGPITNPYLLNETTGKTLAFNGTIASGDYIDVDFLNRTVILNGTGSRYFWIVDSSGWWNLIPGANSVRLGGSPGSPSPTMTVQWRDAYA